MSQINLDVLHQFAVLDQRASAGAPMPLPLDQVHEDPNQPRKAFNTEALAELTQSVRVSGVKSPISVRAHPSLAGHYVLNFGARRLRAARAAGLESIPAFIDEAHTDYEQVVENLQRDDLTPMEMAQFIDTKLKAGDSAAEVARRLGIDRAQVTKYGALIEAPAEIEAVYREGRCTSPDTLYDLRKTFSQWPLEVTAWLASGEEVTRRSASGLRKRLTEVDISAKPITPEIAAMAGMTGPSQSAGPEARPPSVPSTLSVDRERSVARLRVSVAGRDALLRLDRWPVSPEGIVVEWVDGGVVEEVAAEAVRVVGVTLR